MTYNMVQDAIDTIGHADFRDQWPLEVRKDLARAALHEGDWPPYAVARVERALRTAKAIERRLNKDIVVGEAGLSHAERKALAK